jgi:thioredoxin reductase (NADPH)
MQTFRLEPLEEHQTTPSDAELYDVIIVGGGPAGLTAGLYAARSKLKAILFEKLLPGGELLNTELIEDYPGFESIRGVELAERMERHARKFGLHIEIAAVNHVYLEGHVKRVETDMGTYRSKALILTSGGEPVKLGVPGEEEFRGRGVSYCAVCDGAFFQGKVIAVVGGGDSAFQEGHFLTRYASKLYLIHRRDTYRAQPLLVERLFSVPSVEAITNTVVEEICGSDKVEYLKLRTGDRRWELPVDGLFIFIGFRPNTRFLRFHVDHDDNGYILTDHKMETSVPGVYAAGDVRAQLARQITTAVGDATTAALAAERYIEDFNSGRLGKDA